MLRQLGLEHKKIIFVRHGQSIGNAKGFDDQSLVDIPNYLFGLSDKGQQEARLAGQKFLDLGLAWDKSFVSTYRRTQETFQNINSIYQTTDRPVIDSRLNEWWRGIWHTMSKEDIAKYYPLEDKIKKREGWYHYRAPGGQAGPDVELQIYSFLTDFIFGIYSDSKTILIVGHGKWAILFWRIMTGSTVDEAETKFQLSPFGNCSISICSGDGFNTISH